MKKFLKALNELYPFTFMDEVGYGTVVLVRGKREETYLRRLNEDEKRVLDEIDHLIKICSK